MKKAWSITTTLRNPDRLRNFLVVLKDLENSEWDLENQKKYQILLIQNRLYGYGNRQFYNGLSEDQVSLIDDPSKEIPFDKATEIFITKNYRDPAMRGRQSINPLKKLGLVTMEDGIIKVSDLGKLFLKEDFDFGEIFFRSFLKWQLPNPESRDYPSDGDYDIKPFIGTLQLINRVNVLETGRDNKSKGLSKNEFALFVPSLIHYESINDYADKIIELRDLRKGKNKQEQKEIFDNYKKEFISSFLDTIEEEKINKFESNLKDYGDNAIRYFRLTRYLYIRGNGFYVDLEPRRSVEIENLLKHDSAKSLEFSSSEEYLDYITDISEPKLPWETKEEYTKIIKKLIEDVSVYEDRLSLSEENRKDYSGLSEDDLKIYIRDLRDYRRKIQDKENHQLSQNVEKIKEYVEALENIRSFEVNRPIILEKYISLGLTALNDAIKIKPNYPVGDDNEPTFTAPANTPDIECYYETHNAICEVTMLERRDQWYNEGQPVMRHLRDFENKDESKTSYCLFIAPTLHRDTVNTFWTAVKYEYEGKAQKIVPMTIDQFIEVLKTLIELKEKGAFLEHKDIFNLYDTIINSSAEYTTSSEWLRGVPILIDSWGSELVS